MSNQLTQPTKKTCTKCGVEKELREFSEHKDCADGRRGQCKECRREQEKERVRNFNSTRDLPVVKKCCRCVVEKSLEEFYADKRHSDGKQGHCKQCSHEASSKWQKENPEQAAKNRRRYYGENSDKVKEQNRRWNKANPDRAKAIQRKYRESNPDKVKEKHLKSKYGLSLEQFNEILRRQKGGCAVCGIKLDGKTYNTRPHVDHCHTTGIVRGILCGNHNSAEGLLGGLENARKMLEYLERNSLFYSASRLT